MKEHHFNPNGCNISDFFNKDMHGTSKTTAPTDENKKRIVKIISDSFTVQHKKQSCNNTKG